MKILYCLTSRFPFGRAYASRALNICRMLRDAGNEVYVLCDYLSEELVADRNCDATVFENIRIITTYETSFKERSLKQRFTVSKDAVKKLDKILHANSFDVVISSSSSDRFAGVWKTVSSYRIPLILEICEWFDSYSWDYGKADPRHWQFVRCWNKYFPKADGVLAISRLLEDQFVHKIKNVARIPTVLDIDNSEYRTEKNHEGIRLLFAGDISTGKDRLVEVIEAINSVKYSKNVSLDIFGPGINDIIKQSDGKIAKENINQHIIVHGFRPQHEINSVCCEADFGLILRPDRRSSNAGFPTKLGEYLAAGTPVIANDTGDICCYIKDGYNGFILEDIKPHTISDLLSRICEMSNEDLVIMRKNARKTAEQFFNYKAYQNQMDSFVKKVVQGE